jgi:hypothetical protein
MLGGEPRPTQEPENGSRRLGTKTPSSQQRKGAEMKPPGHHDDVSSCQPRAIAMQAQATAQQA